MRERLVVLLVVGAIAVAVMAVPAAAAPADGNDNKVVGEESDGYGIGCEGTAVLEASEEWSQVLTLRSQEVQLVHVTRTYTVDGESLPFFRFVSSWVERPYLIESGETLSVRSGLDEGFIGRRFWSDWTGGYVVAHGQETLDPDVLACEALLG